MCTDMATSGLHALSIILTLTTVVIMLLAYSSPYWEEITLDPESVQDLNIPNTEVSQANDSDKYFLLTMQSFNVTNVTFRETTFCIPVIRVSGLWQTCDTLEVSLRENKCGNSLYELNPQCEHFSAFGSDISDYVSKDAPERLHMQLTRMAQSTSIVGIICVFVGLGIGIFATAFKQVVCGMMAGLCLFIGAVYSVFATCLMMMRLDQTAKLSDTGTVQLNIVSLPILQAKVVTYDWSMFLSWGYIITCVFAGLCWLLTSYVLRVRIVNGTIPSAWAYKQLCGLDQ